MAAAAAAPLLSCRGVSKHFGALAAVQDLSFDLAEGEVLGIGGPNGAGKTTLFDVISGLEPITSGAITFAGREISALSPEQVCHLGLARTFQLNAGFDSLTVRENVLVASYFGAANRRVPGLRIEPAAARRAEEALELVGLGGSGDLIVETLSVLERKLLMLAGAIATEPRLLLLDEPVGGLNPKEIERVQEVFRNLQARGMSIILIEHVMRFLISLSTRVLIMHHGEKIYEGVPGGLVKEATVIDVYLGEGASKRLSAHIEAGSGAA